MHLRAISQEEILGFKKRPVDLVIAASGYERRAPTVARRLGVMSARRLAVGFKEEEDNPQRVQNDALFTHLGYHSLLRRGGDSEALASVLLDELRAIGGRSASVLVDISSMTRTWYGGAIHALRFGDIPQDKLQVTFAYTPAAFRRREERYPQNRYVGPVPGFLGLGLPILPAALVVGLGQDNGRALGVHAEVDPGLSASFIASPGTDVNFEPAVRKANADFLEVVPPELRFEYPLLDFPTLFYRLRDVCLTLTEDWHVVLVALGPKIFSVSCFLVATEMPGVSVWRVSAGEREKPVDRLPGKSIILAATEWEKI